MLSPEEIRTNLDYATGTENYYRLFPGRDDVLLTDGVKTMADMCEAWWLLNDIAVHCRHNAKVRSECFTVWKLTLDGTKARLTGDDGNDNILVTQTIPYTDFPLPEGIKLYKDGAVIMLPSEY